MHCKVELQNELNSNKDIRYKKLEISVEEIGTSPFVTFHKVQTATDTSSRPPPSSELKLILGNRVRYSTRGLLKIEIRWTVRIHNSV